LGGAAGGLLANLVSYALALVLFTRIKTVDDAGGARRAAARGGFAAGLRYVSASRALAVVVGSFALVTLATGLVNATLPKFTTGLGLGAGGYGFALAALACGMMTGEALTGAVAEHVDARWLGPALAAMGGLFVAFAWASSPAA